ncbi:helix-turn-helix transcriptional regulator [Ktedonobacter sp. SOSP1-52]|uniref:helix-turn-helix transcriptional regulator n=1 Tax=Ktedonobacter sp. SOSP1-52 TaxID=2778366 RepID=UPI0019154054|nr:helix-turn-helix transcriptional regulator [Ktedonobacter sp. SOSP1-52]
MQHTSPSLFRDQWPAYYHDQPHFIKEFKRFTGFTPQQYTAIVNEFGRAFSAKL